MADSCVRYLESFAAVGFVEGVGCMEEIVAAGTSEAKTMVVSTFPFTPSEGRCA
jgi:hypothetical protein